MNFSIIEKSQLEGGKRIDAEYYQREFLETVKLIRSKNHKNLADIISILTDYHANGSYEILRNNVRLLENQDYALMIRAIDLEQNKFNNDVRYVSESAYNFLRKTKLYGEEIIIDKIGNTGEVFLMPKLGRPVTLGMNLFMIRLKKDYDPIYVYTFLISKYGKLLINQRITGTVPTSIDKESVKGILIPLPSEKTIQEVRILVNNHLTAIETSRNLYQEAETLLLEELGLKNFKFKNDLFFIVNSSKAKDRIDADYFHPKYEENILMIKKHNAKSIEQISTLIGHPIQSPYDPSGDIAVLAQKHMKTNLKIDSSEFDNFTKELLISKNDRRFFLKKGDLIISSVGNPGLTCMWTDDYKNKVIPGSFVTVVRPKKGINSSYIGVFLNTFIGKLQFERYNTGSVQQYVYPNKIKEILIPIFPESIQEKIAELVKKSLEAKKKSKELLEAAKRKVEEIIEKGDVFRG